MVNLLKRLFPRTVDDHVLVLRTTAANLRKLCEARKGEADFYATMGKAAIDEATKAERIAQRFEDLTA